MNLVRFDKPRVFHARFTEEVSIENWNSYTTAKSQYMCNDVSSVKIQVLDVRPIVEESQMDLKTSVTTIAHSHCPDLLV